MAIQWYIKNPALIGGAVCRQQFKLGSHTFRWGDTLARDQVLAIPVRNRQALIASGYFDVFPVKEAGERFLVSAGKGLFHVVEGVRVTREPVSKDDAEALLVPTKSRAA